MTIENKVGEVQGEGRDRFETWAETILGDNPNWRESGNGELARQAWQAALAACQPVGDEERAETFRKGWEAGNAAQGIDLGQFRDAITREYANSRALCAMPRILECERLLALIDAQRDAAPGVSNSPTCNESLQVATLATVKPPRDLRTKVPAVAEIREDG